MAEARESSGLHSLAELRRLAADESRKQAESAQRARLAAERERARIEQERADHERALRAAAESGLHAEIERLEAARRAESEHALREAQNRRELELALVQAQNREQRQELARAASASRARAWLAFAWGSSAAIVLLAAGAYLSVVRPESAALRAALTASQAENGRLRSDNEASSVRAHAREVALGDRVGELERALREAQNAPTPSRPNPPAPTGPRIFGTKPPPPAPRGPCRDHDDGDPLNPCLGAHPPGR